MNTVELARYKQLANDAIIAHFGSSGDVARLTEALEKAVDELDDIANECDRCKYCEVHGNYESEKVDVDADEVLAAHRALTSKVEALRVLVEADGDDLAENALDRLADIESDLDDLGRTVIA